MGDLSNIATKYTIRCERGCSWAATLTFDDGNDASGWTFSSKIDAPDNEYEFVLTPNTDGVLLEMAPDLTLALPPVSYWAVFGTFESQTFKLATGPIFVQGTVTP